MTMVLCVPGALLGADRALANAGLQQTLNDAAVRLGRPGEHRCHEAADISATQAERDARAHLRYVSVDEIRSLAGEGATTFAGHAAGC
jgi:hypothetical protein